MPTTSVGRWALWLEVAFVVLFAIAMIAVANNGHDYILFGLVGWPPYGIVMLALGLVAGGLAITALVKRDRSWLLWAMLLVPIFVVVLLVGEFLIPPFD